MASTGGRAPPSQNTPMPCAGSPSPWSSDQWRTNGGPWLDLAQLSVLSLECLHLLGHLGRHARAPAAVDLRLLDPLVRAAAPHSQPSRRSTGSLPSATCAGPPSAIARTSGAMPSIQHHPHRARAHLRRILGRCLAHDAPPYSGVGASGKPGAVQDGGQVTRTKVLAWF